MLAATKISNKQTKHTDNHFIDKYPGITRSVVNAAKSATENYLNNLIQLQKKSPMCYHILSCLRQPTSLKFAVFQRDP